MAIINLYLGYRSVFSINGFSILSSLSGFVQICKDFFKSIKQIELNDLIIVIASLRLMHTVSIPYKYKCAKI